MTRRAVLGIAMAAMLTLTAMTQRAEATHFRYGVLSWEPTTTAGEVEFQLTAAFRRDSGWGPVNTGATITETQGATQLNFGDGNFTPTLQFEIVAHSVSENWVIGIALDPSTGARGIRHTYLTGGPFTAYLASSNGVSDACCRILSSSLNNRPSGDYPLETLVSPNAGNRSPVSAQAPIVVVSEGAAVQFPVAAADPDGDPIRFRLSTIAEAGGGLHPSGLTVDAITGIVTWNNVGLNQSRFWTTQIVVEDLDATGAVMSKTPVDFLLQIAPCAAINTQPTCTIVPDPGGLPILARVGVPVMFTITGDDIDPGDMVEINSSGLPPGAIMTPALPTSGTPPVGSDFLWIPTLADLGTHVIQFSVRDMCGAQSLCPVVIEVEEFRGPEIATTGDVCGTTQVVLSGATLTFDVMADSLGAAGTLEVDGLPPGATMTPGLPLAGAGPLMSTFEWTPTNAQAGQYLVTFTATDSTGLVTTCTVQIRAFAVVTFDDAPIFVPPPHHAHFDVIFDGIDWGNGQWLAWEGECGGCNSRLVFPNFEETVEFTFLRTSILTAFDASTHGWSNDVILESYDEAGNLLETFGPVAVDPEECTTYETGFTIPAHKIVYHYPGRADLGIDNLVYIPIGALPPPVREAALVYFGNGGFDPGGFRYNSLIDAVSGFGMRVDTALVELPHDLDIFCTIYLSASSVAYDADQVVALAAYLARGGVLVAIADNDTMHSTGAYAAVVMSQLAADLGSTMSIVAGTFGCGCQETFEIANHPLTDGVVSLWYNCAASVDPGDGEVLAWANPLAPAATSGAGAPSVRSGVQFQGPALLAVESVGGGTLVLAGDVDLFEGPCTHNGNVQLMKNLCERGFSTAPVADPQMVATDEDTPILIVLTGSDPNGDPLTFSIATPPTNGGLGAINPISPTSAEVLYTPDLNYNGPDMLIFEVDDGTGGTDQATVAINVISVNDPPVAVLDGYLGAIGNTEYLVGVAPPATPAVTSADPDVLFNDSDVDGPSLAVVAGLIATVNGGEVAMNADGTFSYRPAAGFTGVDSFDYELTDTIDTVMGTAQITVGDRVWYVNNTNAAPGDGRSHDPFQALADAGGASFPGDIIFLYRGDGTSSFYDAGITLQNGQTLLGQGNALMVGPVLLVPADAGARPIVENTAGNGISLASNNTVRGLSIGDTTGSGLNGTALGTLTVDDTTIGGNGRALNLQNGTLAVTLEALSSNAGNEGIRLSSVSGSLTVVSGTTITNPTGQGLRVLSSGGLVADFGATSVTGTGGTAVLLFSNAGATLTFASLAASSNNGSGAEILNSGVVNIGGAGNTVSAANGQGLRVLTQAMNWTFSSVSSAGSPDEGIEFTNTSGSINITGGSITNSTGPAFSVVNGNATIEYAGTIDNTADRAVMVMNTTGGSVTLSGPSITDSGTGADTGTGIRIAGMAGSASIANASITNPDTDAVTVTSSTGTSTFTNLDVVTSGNRGLVGFNAGGIDISAGSTIASTGAGAVDINGANMAIVLDSVSSNGGSRGIRLSNTTGSFTSSAGVIQNTTLDGVFLFNSSNITLNNMTFQDLGTNGIDMLSVGNVNLDNATILRAGTHGINGRTTNGFTLTNSLIEDCGNANNEHGINFSAGGGANLTGAVLISGTTITDSANTNVLIRNNSGVLNMTIDSSTISDTIGNTFGDDGLLIDASGTSNITLTVQNGSLFSGLESDGIAAFAQGTGQMTLNVLNSTFNGSATGVLSATGSDNAMSIRSNNTAMMTATVMGNTIDANNTAILMTSDAGSTFRATVDANTIGTVGVLDSGSVNGRGIDFMADDSSNARVVISGNNVAGVDFEGIYVVAQDTAGLDANVTGNTVATPDDNSAFPLGIESMQVRALELSVMCANIQSNTVGPGSMGFNGIRVQQRNTATFNLERLNGGAGNVASTATVAAHVVSENTVAAVTASIATFFTGVANGGCLLP